MSPARHRLAIALAVAAIVAAVLLVALRRGPPATGGAARVAPPPSTDGTPAGAPLAAPAPGLPITVAPRSAAAPDALPASFDGRVVSRATGHGVPGAELTFSRAGAAASVRAGADGAFRFEPPADGRWLLAAVTAPGFLPFAPEWGHSPVQLEARAGVHVRGIAVHLAPAAELVGRVLDAEGRPAPGAEVRLLGARGEAALVPIADRFTSGPDGQFRFSAPRGAVLEARRPGFAAGRAEVDLAATVEGRLTITLGAPEEERAEPGRIAGRVVSRASGAPLPGALVVAEREAWGMGLVRTAQVAAGADGAFELGGLEAGRYRVTARAEGLAPGAVRPVEPGADGVVLELGDGGRLRGCVRDAASGAPAAPFTVLVFRRRTALFRSLQESRSFVDASGCYALEDLAPGPAMVVVSAPGFAPSGEIAVELAPGSEAVADAALERGARLGGTVVDAETGAPLPGAVLSVEGALTEAASTFPVLAAATADGAGRFVLDGLPRRFSVLAAAAGHHARLVSLGAGRAGDAGPVEIALRPLAAGETPRVELAGIGAGIAIRGDALAITAVAQGGGAAEAGLARGDLILRVEGVAVGELGFQGAVDAIRGPEGTSVLLRVRRGEEAFEIRVPRRLVRG